MKMKNQKGIKNASRTIFSHNHQIRLGTFLISGTTSLNLHWRNYISVYWASSLHLFSHRSFLLIYKRSSSIYGLGSLKKTVTEGLLPKGPCPISDQFSLILQLNHTQISVLLISAKCIAITCYIWSVWWIIRHFQLEILQQYTSLLKGLFIVIWENSIIFQHDRAFFLNVDTLLAYKKVMTVHTYKRDEFPNRMPF